MKIITNVTLILCLLFIFKPIEAGLFANKKMDPNKSKVTLEEMVDADSSLKAFKKNSVGYAVFPRVAKGGMGIGGAYGKGHLFVKGKAVGTVSLTQVSYGLQLGGQVYSEVIFFQTKEALTSLKPGLMNSAHRYLL